MPGARLTLDQRIQIEVGRAKDESFTAIADRIGAHRTTVAREVRLNWPPHSDRYLALAAHAAAMVRAPRPKARKLAVGTPLRAEVVRLMTQDWSMQQIAGRLRLEHPDEPQWWVSHETIYKAWYIQGKGSLRAELLTELGGQRPRTGTARRRPRGERGDQRRSRIVDPTPIGQRPDDATNRLPGHWEGDLIIGPFNRSALATVVERCSRFTLAVTLPQGRNTDHVTTRLAQTITALPDLLFTTLTWDRGAEMAAHKQFHIDTGIQVYFADPYSPWQRPTNENTNRLLRDYLPKSRDLTTVTDPELNTILHKLNSRPRKVLGYRTPAEVLTDTLNRATTP